MKYCKKCKREYSESQNFCENCGGKLVKFIEREDETKHEKKKVEASKMVKSSLKPKKLMVVIASIIIVIFFISLLYTYSTGIFVSSTSSAGGSIGQPSQSTNQPSCRQVQEPYQTPLSYSVVDSSLKENWNLQLGYYYEYKITVSNSDSYGGEFTVNFNLQTSKHGALSNTKAQYISAHSTETFSSTFDTDMGEQVSGTYQITPPTKTEYRTVTKCD